MGATVRWTAYGADALEKLGEVVRAAKAGDPMAPVTVVVPSNLAGIMARRHLATQEVVPGRKGIAALYVTTLRRLAEQAAAVHLHPRRPATAAILASAWRSALDAAAGVFEPVKDHPATVEALVRAHRELRDLDAAGLDRVAGHGPLQKDLVGLHRDVLGRLASGWYDETDLLVQAIGRTTAEATPVVLYLPQRLTEHEARWVRHLHATRPLDVVAGFTAVRRADRATLEGLARAGIEADPPASGRTAATGQSDEDDRRPTATEVLHASDSDDEVRVVVREVLKALEDLPAHRIAVLYSNATPYARLLHEHLLSAGVSVNGPGVRSVRERALSRGLVALLHLAGSDWRRGDVFDALAEAPTRRTDGTSVPVARWDRLSREAGVSEGDDWSRRLAYFRADTESAIRSIEKSADPSPGRMDAIRRDIADAEALSGFVSELRRLVDPGASLTTWPALADWASDVFRTMYGGSEQLASYLPSDEKYAAVVLESTLAEARGLAGIESTASLRRLLEVLTTSLDAALPRVGTVGSGVYVGPISSAVGMVADRTFVVGLAEDLYPGRVRPDALLPDALRSGDDGPRSGLRSPRDDLDTSHLHFLAAVSSAPFVLATLPRGNLRRSTDRFPSRFLLSSLRRLTGDHRLAATDWEDASIATAAIRSADSYAGGVLTADFPSTHQEWRVRALSAGVDVPDEVLDRVTRLRDARASDDFTVYDGNLTDAEGLPDHATSGRALSPTALQDYANCPHAYFLRRLLRVEPLEAPDTLIKISALDYGTLVHETLDAFIKEQQEQLPGFGEPWTTEHRRSLLEVGRRQAEQMEARGVTGHPVMWADTRRQLEALLLTMLDQDDAFRREQDAKVEQSELAFGTADVPPVEIDVPGGRLLMRGSADLVHLTRRDELIVTDVKTSTTTTTYKAVALDPVAQGKLLQLPVYAKAAARELGRATVRSAYWLPRARGKNRVELTLNADVERRYADAVGTLSRSIAHGLFPAVPPERDDPPTFVYCPYCNPDGVGYTTVRDSWTRKRSAGALRSYVGLVDPTPLTPQEDER